MSKVISISHAHDISGKDIPSLQGDNESSPRSCAAALNALFCSLVTDENCKRFRAFPEGYCREYGLSLEQIHAITDLDVVRLLKLGGTAAQLERLTRIYGLDLNELCTDQCNKTLAEIQKLLTR